jgi:hypothetical protein
MVNPAMVNAQLRVSQIMQPVIPAAISLDRSETVAVIARLPWQPWRSKSNISDLPVDCFAPLAMTGAAAQRSRLMAADIIWAFLCGDQPGFARWPIDFDEDGGGEANERGLFGEGAYFACAQFLADDQIRGVLGEAEQAASCSKSARYV